jgi:hypothetical protein
MHYLAAFAATSPCLPQCCSGVVSAYAECMK